MSKKFLFVIILFLSTSFNSTGSKDYYSQETPTEQIPKVDKALTELIEQKIKVEYKIETIRDLEEELQMLKSE